MLCSTTNCSLLASNFCAEWTAPCNGRLALEASCCKVDLGGLNQLFGVRKELGLSCTIEAFDFRNLKSSPSATDTFTVARPCHEECLNSSPASISLLNCLIWGEESWLSL